MVALRGIKAELHPRNRHRARYDFPRLIQASPELARFVARKPHGPADESIDFADPKAVKALNRAILTLFYGVRDWDIPEGYLCPPIPGRADYIHHAADLLGASRRDRQIPRGSTVRVLDIGTGANLVYPLLGHHEYGWSFVGCDINAEALQAAESILTRNPHLVPAIELRLQPSREEIFTGIIRPGEKYELTICNPPFHSSAAEAQAGTRRKWKNLGKPSGNKCGSPKLNFEGRDSELWCPGGERGFILRMIEESPHFAPQCHWFTTLVSKATLLPTVIRALKKAKVRDHRILEMAQGQKRSRIVSWTFAP